MNNLQTVEAVKATLPSINFENIVSEHGGFAVVTFTKDQYRDFRKTASNSEVLAICKGEYTCSRNTITQRIKLH